MEDRQNGLILVLLGLIYNNGLQLIPFSYIRFSSVLGRIGIAYMLAGIIYLYASQRAQIVWFAGSPIGYWLILKFMSAPGYPAGDLTMQGNFASYVDRTVLPGKLSLGIDDTVGFSRYSGYQHSFGWHYHRDFFEKQSENTRTKSEHAHHCRYCCLGLSSVWNLDFPINKNMWSVRLSCIRPV